MRKANNVTEEIDGIDIFDVGPESKNCFSETTKPLTGPFFAQPSGHGYLILNGAGATILWARDKDVIELTKDLLNLAYRHGIGPLTE